MTTKERDNKILEDLNKLFVMHGIDYEEFFYFLGRIFIDMANEEKHETVKKLLMAVTESMDQAAFDYYASTK